MSYQIFNEDCQKGIKKLEENSIDIIITDPPYFIDRMDSAWNDEKLKHSKSKAGVIGGLPVGMKFDRAQGQKLQEFLEPLAREFYRVLKPGGFCIVFSQARLYHRTAMALDLAGFEMRDMIGWKYEGQAKAFSQEHFIKNNKNLDEKQKQEIIEQLKGWKTPQLKPQIEPMTLAQKPKIGTFVDNFLSFNVGLMNTNESIDAKFPGNIIQIPKSIRKSECDEKIEHMTIKPVALISHLIKLFTKKHALVLDAFMGSGSCGVAALANDRNFIGFEIEKKYFEIAKARMQKLNESSLFA